MSSKAKGALLIIISAFGFAMMSVFVNLSGNAPLEQKLLFRNLVPLIGSFVVIVAKKIPTRIPKGAILPFGLRVLCGLMSALCNFYAITRLLLANANSLNKLSPFFAILLAALFLRDRLNGKQLLCVAAALIGCLFIIAPGFRHFEPASLVAMAGGILSGGVHTCTRSLRNRYNMNGWVIICLFSLVCTLFYAVQVIVADETWNLQQVIYMFGAGCCALLGQITMTAAYCYAAPSEITIYDCTQIIFGGLLGFIIFGQIPSTMNFIAYIFIIGASIALFQVNKQLTKKTE